ncbi:hypothetical protein [Pisciglobus halotolerans]|uniref:Phage protein, HK97 gp10 family n=1 Tax=Pisciglobus halotolerans TaxID=745365 RepID=A0A1I3C234_9LACT|nr:hypothetical protein [Pisciglobus halotolerans]SFH68625.1 hypothetical protein SAMN04489868_11236 [Pisciglobus halotolerans]
MVKFQLNAQESERIEQAMARIPEESERMVNDVLKSKGVKKAIESIVGFMPISDRKKAHAKLSNPLKQNMINLGFEITPKPRFGYLVFPNDGIGRSNPVKQQFFENGLEKVTDSILDDVVLALEEASNKALGN